jgi:hypothetical protein
MKLSGVERLAALVNQEEAEQCHGRAAEGEHG